jgi:hypothetical protein
VFVALSFDTVRDVALGVAVAAVVLAVVAAIVIKWIVGKLLALVLLLAVAGIVWWQRDTLQDCAGRVRQTMVAGSTDSTTCAFFGGDVTVGSPLG